MSGSFDQRTEHAAFVTHLDDIETMCLKGWGFKPLDDILAAYLDMIGQGKVFAVPEDRKNEASLRGAHPKFSFTPWFIYSFLYRDRC